MAASSDKTKNDSHIQDFNDFMKKMDSSYDNESMPTSTFSDMDDIFSCNSGNERDPESGNHCPGEKVRKEAPSRNKKTHRNSCCCICTRIVTPVVMLTVIVAFLILFFGDSSSLQKVIPGLYESEDFGEQLIWRRSAGQVGGGLDLMVVNALDSSWYSYFDAAVQDWDSGTPDALTLSSQVASAPDPECNIVEGILKICNNNYGETGWMGVNNVVKYDGLIAGSVGMMNDFYFSSNDDAKRQYTMCHEMGHGFGLPHTDTLLWNSNKRNCLDYTNRPKTNMRPGTINYKRLADVYGTVEGNSSGNFSGSNTTVSNDEDSNTHAPNSENTNGVAYNSEKEQRDNDQSNEKRRLFMDNSQSSSGHFPSSVKDALDRLHQRQLSNEFMGDVTDGDIDYELDVGSGYTIHVQYMKAF